MDVLDDSRNVFRQSLRRAQSALTELDDSAEHNPLSGGPLPSVSGLSVQSSKEWAEILPVKTEYCL